MKINIGFFISKFFRLLNRPALRDCNIDKKAKVGTGSNCINVTMGKYSYMGKNNSVSNATIGSFCSIASYCAIGGGDHELNYVSTSPVFYRGRNIFNRNLGSLEPNINKKVEIGNDVWIGEACFINSGVRIGNGVVIGAHSVVTRDVPDYAIVAGAPARIIRFRFDEETIQKFNKSKWWDYSDDILKQKSEIFNDPKLFLDKVGE